MLQLKGHSMQEPRQFNSIVIPILGFTASGGNRVLSKLADSWLAMGIQVEFLVENDSTPYFPTKARISRCAKSGDTPKILGGLLNKFGILLSVMKLARLLRARREDYDLVIANHFLTAIACALAGCSDKTIYYVQAYDPEILRKKRKLSSWVASVIAQLSYLLCRNQIVNSSHYLKYKFINSHHVIPPGIDLNLFRTKLTPGEFQSEIIRVGIIGRRELYKALPVLNAYRALRSVTVQTRLMIAFGNIDSENLNQIGEYEILTPKNDSELAEFYRDCDIFLALSEFGEGAFYPVLESLASGTTLVCNGGFYKASHMNSWIVDDPGKLESIMKEIIGNHELRVSKSTRGILDIQDLSWSNIAPAFLGYAKQIISK